jgi:hypothetical protein
MRGLFLPAMKTASLSVFGIYLASERRRDRIDDRLADSLEEADLGGFQLFQRFAQACLGGLQTFAALETIGIGQGAALDALVDVADHRIVEGDVVLRSRDDLVLEHVFQIVLGHLEGQRFGALKNAEGGAVDARSLLIDLRLAATAIIERLADREADIAGRQVVAVGGQSTGRVVRQPATPDTSLQINGRQV